ncbi:ATPase, T2SS/T4P/T4SS family [Acetobacter malorum]|uniref:ATPase, T2SS/T4P/T4SS family n=1 Tax=Acetobacter malorum TaxID=178901 RepID=UPI000777AA9B|nr:ATPase, T2SS/T4P/T4SS family [Acetobacter malorum]
MKSAQPFQPISGENDGGYGTWLGPVSDCGERPLGRNDFFYICNFAVRMPLSDLIIQTGKPIFVSHHGTMTAITRPVGLSDVERILEWATMSQNSVFRLRSGNDIDGAFSIPDLAVADEWGQPVRHRFRLNVTCCLYNGATGYQLVMRYINPVIPSVESVALEPEIMAEMTPKQGGVILLGEVGSGKSSTLAAGLREVAAGRTPIRGNVVTYESPIEYDFESLSSAVVTFAQTEVPINLPTFSHGSRNSLRRKPGLVMLGELRDSETIESATELMVTGVPLLGTAHSNSVAVAYSRMVQKFPTNLQSQAFYSLVANIHMFVSQRLVPHREWTREKPKMVCLREWQVMTDDIRARLETAGPERHIGELRRIMNDPGNATGRSMLTTIRRHFAEGSLSVETAHQMLLTYGYHVRDLEGGNA